jgi:hypothetical protein
VAAGAAVAGAAVAGATVAGPAVAGAAVAGATVGVAAGAQLVNININKARAVIIFPIFFISLFSSIKQGQIEVTRYNGNTSEDN